jgi:hypothetical protein
VVIFLGFDIFPLAVRNNVQSVLKKGSKLSSISFEYRLGSEPEIVKTLCSLKLQDISGSKREKIRKAELMGFIETARPRILETCFNKIFG